MKKKNYEKIGIIGLGYVGLPLAIEFSNKFDVVGFDLNKNRIIELKNGIDKTSEIKKKTLKKSKIFFSNNLKDLENCNIFIITVPTPINYKKEPDLRLLKKACQLVAKIIKKGDIIIFESTVYPGVTEKICVPIIRKESGLEYNKDFFVGYSPERINPGDKKHRLTNIKKVTAGSTVLVSKKIDKLYAKIIKAGTYKVKNIQIAEAAKVIENAQRDLNIAFVNELAIIFDKLNIDTESVLKAASTKWNFLKFAPGLVGGHCIGIDPYYLTFKAKEAGYTPKVITAGRKLNDSMSKYVVKKILNISKKKKIKILNSKILVMGLTFKENVPDVRNSRVIDLVNLFKSYGSKVDVYDPLIEKNIIKKKFKIDLTNKPFKNYYDIIILAVPHKKFKSMKANHIKNLGKKKCIIFDIKNQLSKDESDGRL